MFFLAAAAWPLGSAGLHFVSWISDTSLAMGVHLGLRCYPLCIFLQGLETSELVRRAMELRLVLGEHELHFMTC